MPRKEKSGKLYCGIKKEYYRVEEDENKNFPELQQNHESARVNLCQYMQKKWREL